MHEWITYLFFAFYDNAQTFLYYACDSCFASIKHINTYQDCLFFCLCKQMLWLFVDERQIKKGLKSLYSLNFKWIWFFVSGYNNNNNTNNKNDRSEDGESAGNGKNMLARKLSTKGDTLYLERRVGLFSGVALIVGTMIGELRYNN